MLSTESLQRWVRLPRRTTTFNAVFTMVLFVLWYSFSSFFNVLVHKGLLLIPIPLLATGITCLAGLLFCVMAYPSCWKASLLLFEHQPFNALLLGVCYMLSNFLTVWSLLAPAWSIKFTQSIKACEPVFTVIISFLVLGKRYSRRVYLSLLTMVVGVVVLSTAATNRSDTEQSHSAGATPLMLALMSTIALAMHNTLSKFMIQQKRLIVETIAEDTANRISASDTSEEETVTAENSTKTEVKKPHYEAVMFAASSLYAIPFVLAFSLLIPYFRPEWNELYSTSAKEVAASAVSNAQTGGDADAPLVRTAATGWILLLAAAVCHCVYNMSSFAILARVSPATHSIGRSMKRVFVIITTVVLIGIRLSFMSFVGMGLVITGIIFYSGSPNKEEYTSRHTLKQKHASSFGGVSLADIRSYLRSALTQRDTYARYRLSVVAFFVFTLVAAVLFTTIIMSARFGLHKKPPSAVPIVPKRTSSSSSDGADTLSDTAAVATAAEDPLLAKLVLAPVEKLPRPKTNPLRVIAFGSYWMKDNDIVKRMHDSLVSYLGPENVLIVDPKLYSGSPALYGKYVEKRGEHGVLNWIKDSALTRTVDMFGNVDAVICVAGGLSPKRSGHQWLRKRNILSIGIALSDPDDFKPRTSHFAEYFDLFFTNAVLSLDDYRTLRSDSQEPISEYKPTYHLPFAAEPTYHRPLPLSDVDDDKPDVVIVGHGRHDRVDLIRSMHSAGLKVHIYGDNWQLFQPLGFRVRVRAQVNGEDQVRAVQSGTVYLSFAKTMAGYSNVKVGVFEAAATGACVLVDHMDEVEHYFKRGTEILTYHSPSYAVDIALQMKANPSKAAEIGAAARRRVLMQHTWQHRWAYVFSKMDALLMLRSRHRPAKQLSKPVSKPQKKSNSKAKSKQHRRVIVKAVDDDDDFDW